MPWPLYLIEFYAEQSAMIRGVADALRAEGVRRGYRVEILGLVASEVQRPGSFTLRATCPRNGSVSTHFFNVDLANHFSIVGPAYFWDWYVPRCGDPAPPVYEPVSPFPPAEGEWKGRTRGYLPRPPLAVVLKGMRFLFP